MENPLVTSNIGNYSVLIILQKKYYIINSLKRALFLSASDVYYTAFTIKRYKVSQL